MAHPTPGVSIDPYGDDELCPNLLAEVAGVAERQTRRI